MNKKLPFTPNETDAILYVIISVLLLMSVNQVLSKPLDSQFGRPLTIQQEVLVAIDRNSFALSSDEKNCCNDTIKCSDESQIP